MYAQPQGTLSSTNTSILTEANTSISHTPNALFQANNTRLSSSGRGINSPKPCTIRPLTAAYNAAGSGNRVSNILIPVMVISFYVGYSIYGGIKCLLQIIYLLTQLHHFICTICYTNSIDFML